MIPPLARSVLPATLIVVLLLPAPWLVAASPPEPGSSALHDGQFVYAIGERGQVRQYRMTDQGALAPLAPPTVTVRGEPWQITAPPGHLRAVYVLEINFATVAQFRVAADGTLRPLSPPRVDAHSHPTAIVFHSLPERGGGGHQRLFAYVSCSHGALCQYRVRRDGRLIPLDPPSVGADTDPSALAFDPQGHTAYVTTPNRTPDGARAGERKWSFTVQSDGTLNPRW
jgi:hypothetical protein